MQVLPPDELHARGRVPDEWAEHPTELAAQEEIARQPGDKYLPGNEYTPGQLLQQRQQPDVAHYAGERNECHVRELQKGVSGETARVAALSGGVFQSTNKATGANAPSTAPA